MASNNARKIQPAILRRPRIRQVLDPNLHASTALSPPSISPEMAAIIARIRGSTTSQSNALIQPAVFAEPAIPRRTSPPETCVSLTNLRKVLDPNLLANTAPPSTSSTEMASISARTLSTTSQTNAPIQSAVFAVPAIPRRTSPPGACVFLTDIYKVLAPFYLANTPQSTPSTSSTEMASISARTLGTTSQINAPIQPAVFAEPAIPHHAYLRLVLDPNLLFANTAPSTSSTKMPSINAYTRATTSQINALIQSTAFAVLAIPIPITTTENIAKMAAKHIPTNATPQLQATMYREIIKGLQYIDMITAKYPNQPEVVDRFLAIMREFNEAYKVNLIPATLTVLRKLVNLFKNDPDLLITFKPILPEGWQLQFNEKKMDMVKIVIPDQPPHYIMFPSSSASVNEPDEDELDLSIPEDGPNNNKRDDEIADSQLPPKKRSKP